MEIKIERTPPSVDVRLGVIRRAAASATFQRSPRLRELLTYICERALENRLQDLREQVIGCVVFGRKADYSPGDDNIVRVEVRQLRKRLDEYFGSEGKSEPFTIAIPKGAYVPVFEPRDSKTPEPPQATAAAAAALGSLPVDSSRVASLPVVPPSIAHPSVLHPSVLPSPVVPPIAHPSRVWRRWALTATAIAVALAAYCFWLLMGNQLVARTAGYPAVDRTVLWPYIFNAQRETTIVCADSTLVVAEGMLNRSVTLDEYISRDYLKAEDPSTARLLQHIPNWQFTDLADVRLVQRLFRLNAEQWDKVTVRSAKTMQIHDFTSGNTILLGSNRSNLWNRMFEPMLNFRFDYDQAQRVAFIRNMKPLPESSPPIAPRCRGNRATVIASSRWCRICGTRGTS